MSDFSVRTATSGDASTIVALLKELGGEAAGIAAWFWIYKSFGAARGIYVEDLYVRPEFRGQGLGRALLAHLAAKATAVDGFMEWQVLDWNAPSIAFYKSLGARPRDSWINYRLMGEDLRKLTS